MSRYYSEKLQRFIQSCLFVHDDVWEDLLDDDGKLNYDQYSTKPFFLGAQSCVIDTMAGFSEEYLKYLDKIHCLPKNIFIPQRKKESLLYNLMHDHDLLAKVKAHARLHQLNISCFYANAEKPFEEFIQVLKTDKYLPKVFPAPQKFEMLNNKINARLLLQKEKIPVPDGEICENNKELQAYLKHCQRYKCGALLKNGHYESIALNANELKMEIKAKYKFPLLVEKIHLNYGSPICHTFTGQGKSEVLFIVDQIIEEYKHQGNAFPVSLSKHNQRFIQDSALQFSQMYGEEIGVLGLDYLIINDNKMKIVDVNPRFNASTYPFHFLERMGIDYQKVYSTYHSRQVNIKNFSVLYTDAEFEAFDPIKKNGVVLMTPNYNFEHEAVTQLFYLIVGKNKKHVKSLEKNLFSLLDKHKLKAAD